MVPARIANTQPLGLHPVQQLVQEINQSAVEVLVLGKLLWQDRFVVEPLQVVVGLWVNPGKVSSH